MSHEPQPEEAPKYRTYAELNAAEKRDPERMCPACGKPDVILHVTYGIGRTVRRHKTAGGMKCSLSGKQVAAEARYSP
jgi:hypothetical protein